MFFALLSMSMASVGPVWAEVGITLWDGDQLERPIIAEQIDSVKFSHQKPERYAASAKFKSRLERYRCAIPSLVTSVMARPRSRPNGKPGKRGWKMA